MKRVLCALILTTVVVTVLCLIVTTPSASLPKQSIYFTLAEVEHSSGGIVRTCQIIVSNGSQHMVEINGGASTLWFELEYITNGILGKERIHTLGGGNGPMDPGNTITSKFEIPESAMTLKVGLPFTSLTWRGRFAWHIVENYPEAFRPICGFLLIQDERQRSKTEWSEQFLLTNSDSDSNERVGPTIDNSHK